MHVAHSARYMSFTAFTTTTTMYNMPCCSSPHPPLLTTTTYVAHCHTHHSPLSSHSAGMLPHSLDAEQGAMVLLGVWSACTPREHKRLCRALQQAQHTQLLVQHLVVLREAMKQDKGTVYRCICTCLCICTCCACVRCVWAIYDSTVVHLFSVLYTVNLSFTQTQILHISFCPAPCFFMFSHVPLSSALVHHNPSAPPHIPTPTPLFHPPTPPGDEYASATHQQQLAKLARAAALVTQLPNETTHRALQALLDHKDNMIFKRLQALTQPMDTAKEARKVWVGGT